MGAKLIYLPGAKVGECWFLKDIPKKGKYGMGEFKCTCGNVFTARISSVKLGETKSCGCLRLERLRKVLTEDFNIGDKIKGFTFIKRIGPKNGVSKAVFLCIICNKSFVTRISSIKNGHTKSCGCHKKAVLIKRITTHGGSFLKAYRSWAHMKSRCTNPKTKSWHNYGGRGISICKRWLNDFAQFYKDMGEPPSSKHSLDRFPNKNGDYKPSNCRWATTKQQCRNLRKNIILTYKGEKKTLAEWAELYGMEYKTLQSRIKTRKWSVSKSLETTVRPSKNRKIA